MSNPLRLIGKGIIPGIGQGKAVLAVGEKTSEIPETLPYVLLAKAISREFIMKIANASAIVIDEGDVDASIVDDLRRRGVPLVVDTKYATNRINPGDQVQVDAEQNMITWDNISSGCVFCKKHPVVYALQSQFFFAIYDGFPVREGHLLVIPFRHVQYLVELSRQEFADLYSMLTQVDGLLKKTFHADAFNLGLNDGPAAGQTVPHLHFHVVPRKAGDVENPRGGIRNFLPNPLVDYPSAINEDNHRFLSKSG